MLFGSLKPKTVIIQGGVSQKAAYAWVDYLNEVLTADREFLSELIQTRVKCNAKIAMHPQLQVINLNQMDELLADEPPPPPPVPPSGDPYDWAIPFPPLPVYPLAGDFDNMPSPRWVSGLLGLINGFIGVSETGKGPIEAIVDLETKLIDEFVVSEPYKKRR